jgi:hypothetical protein
VPPDELAAGWRAQEARWIYRQQLPDGRPALTLERHPELGFRMFAHRYGHWLVSADGASIRASHAEGLEPWLWQRFLVAQVLPFTALLQGLEVFHASAVVLEDRVLAIVGGSGGGKTSVGLNLVLRGMPFFTDDVLALELRGTELVSMPGPGSANVRDEELRRLCEQADARVGEIVGRGTESLRVVVDRDERELPLGVVYFLERSADHRRLRFEPTTDPYLLLASTFNFVIRTPERLAAQLDTCAALARSAALFRVRAPRSVTAAELATAVADHARGVVAGDRQAGP